MQPDIRSSFVYGGQAIIANWYTVTEKVQIPDLPWEQVYAIGNLDGKVPLVTSRTGEKELTCRADTLNQTKLSSRPSPVNWSRNATCACSPGSRSAISI